MKYINCIQFQSIENKEKMLNILRLSADRINDLVRLALRFACQWLLLICSFIEDQRVGYS